MEAPIYRGFPGWVVVATSVALTSPGTTEVVTTSRIASVQTSTFGHKSFNSLGGQWTAGVGPVERLGHRAVEVVDEVQDTLPQIVN